MNINWVGIESDSPDVGIYISDFNEMVNEAFK